MQTFTKKSGHRDRRPGAISGLAKVAASFSAETFIIKIVIFIISMRQLSLQRKTLRIVKPNN